MITDAHLSISGYLKDNTAFDGYQRVIDFYHASEHLSHMAEAIHGKSSAGASEWYKKYRDILTRIIHFEDNKMGAKCYL